MTWVTSRRRCVACCVGGGRTAVRFKLLKGSCTSCHLRLPSPQSFVIAAKDLGIPLKLKPTKFGAVSSLAIYVEREGADVVALSKVLLHGTAIGRTDVGAIKKHDHDH